MLICLSYVTVTHATDSPANGQYFGADDFFVIDSNDKNDQVNDDNRAVQFTWCYFDQSNSTNLVQYQPSYCLGYVFVRPLTRAPPKITT